MVPEMELTSPFQQYVKNLNNPTPTPTGRARANSNDKHPPVNIPGSLPGHHRPVLNFKGLPQTRNSKTIVGK